MYVQQMIRCKSKKTKEIEDILSKRTGETINIRKGKPDARYKNEYFAYMVTLGGLQAVGTYGIIHKHSKSLNELLDECKEIVYH